MTDPIDPVDQAFERTRALAKRRNGNVPNLGKRGTAKVSRRGAKSLTAEPVKKEGYRGPGRLPGPDGRPQRRPYTVLSLGNLLNKEIQERGWDHEIASGWVSTHWEVLVGPNIAGHTKVEMIKDKKVFISCDSTAWATNLKYMQRQILSSISEKVGPDVVEELRIFGPKAPSWRKGALHVKGRGPRDTYG